MVTPVMIFGYFLRPGFQIGGVGLLINGLGLLIGGLGGGFVDRRPGLMVCVCGSVDGLCLCVCVALLWLGCG